MTTTPYERVTTAAAAINDVLNAINVLTWDSRVHMPAAGAGARSEQLATLTAMAQDRLLDPRLADDVAAARSALGRDATLEQARTLDAIAAATDYHSRLPPELVARLARAKGTAQQAWVQARADDDFGAMVGHLQQMFEIKRELARYTAPSLSAYDALLLEYEPSVSSSDLRALFDRLKAALVPLVREIAAAPAPDTAPLRQRFEVDRQRDFAAKIAARFGFDFGRGRLDDAPHPFEISFSTTDVRITTRYDENWLPQSIFGAWHEAGHGIYEQYADPAHARGALSSDLIGLYAVSGTSYGTHESQSRLWENLVGRSRTFWEANYGELVEAFPEQLRGVDVEAFYRAVNAVQPSMIRVEADEVTYHLHVMLRFEIETSLLEGSLDVRDLPGAWNEAMESYLGVRPRTDREGVLQDIHWSAGLVAAFPTYTIGTVMASQFYAAALRDDPAIDDELTAGSYGRLHGWLREHVYRHARLYRADELLERSTGRGLSADDFLGHVERKYGELYGV